MKISNTFSNTTKPIDAKFYLESPREEETKICFNRPDPSIDMDTMPIYGKNLNKTRIN